jgi:hypothetical protein
VPPAGVAARAPTVRRFCTADEPSAIVRSATFEVLAAWPSARVGLPTLPATRPDHATPTASTVGGRPAVNRADPSVARITVA